MPTVKYDFPFDAVKKIKEYIRVNDLKQKEFAELAGINQTRVSQITNSTHDNPVRLTTPVIERIAAAMDLTRQELLAPYVDPKTGTTQTQKELAFKTLTTGGWEKKKAAKLLGLMCPHCGGSGLKYA